MTLRRYTTLNHLAQAAKALLQNTQQINQMLTDLNRVDFRTVQVCFYFYFDSCVNIFFF
jgi:regulatory factor X 1/2/3